jgi:hypothetical protein
MSTQVTATPSNGGMVLPLAMGAVVVFWPCEVFHTPDSGHFSPVLAVVPNGLRSFRDISLSLKKETNWKSTMPEFGLIKSFDIDNGELDGLSAQEIFVLGYELAQIDYELSGEAEINKPVHADNRQRITKACEDSGRAYRLTWHPSDASESWLLLQVAGRVVNGEWATGLGSNE